MRVGSVGTAPVPARIQRTVTERRTQALPPARRATKGQGGRVRDCRIRIRRDLSLAEGCDDVRWSQGRERGGND